MQINAGFSLDRLEPGFYKYPKSVRQSSVMNKYTTETSAQLFGLYVSVINVVAIF